MLSDMPLYATIPVKDLQESIDFYGQKLGMDIIDEDEHGVWFASGNTRFAIYQSDNAGSSKTPAVIWIVHNPNALIKALEGRGLKFENYKNSKSTIPHGDKRLLKIKYEASWFRDPSGNLICIAGYR